MIIFLVIAIGDSPRDYIVLEAYYAIERAHLYHSIHQSILASPRNGNHLLNAPPITIANDSLKQTLMINTDLPVLHDRDVSLQPESTVKGPVPVSQSLSCERSTRRVPWLPGPLCERDGRYPAHEDPCYSNQAGLYSWLAPYNVKPAPAPFRRAGK